MLRTDFDKEFKKEGIDDAFQNNMTSLQPCNVIPKQVIRHFTTDQLPAQWIWSGHTTSTICTEFALPLHLQLALWRIALVFLSDDGCPKVNNVFLCAHVIAEEKARLKC